MQLQERVNGEWHFCCNSLRSQSPEEEEEDEEKEVDREGEVDKVEEASVVALFYAQRVKRCFQGRRLT